MRYIGYFRTEIDGKRYGVFHSYGMKNKELVDRTIDRIVLIEDTHITVGTGVKKKIWKKHFT